jgi:hypothetical protein
MKDPVRGTAQVVSSTMPPDSATWANCKMSLVVQADGVAPSATEVHDLTVPTRKWPWPGQTLPVTVDRANPGRVRIEWDEVVAHGDRAKAEAEAMAAALRGEAGTAPAQPDGVPPEAAGVVAQLQQVFPGATVRVDSSSVPASPEVIGKVEQATGMDLDGDGRIGPSGATGAAPQAGAVDPEDRIAALERLARLRESGALSASEFEAEKRRLLDS